jgi:(1->4)-alpha-D-glucan 1-alpha-D-glucosylmutase
MQDALAGEINALAHRLERLSELDRHTRDFTLNGLLNALREVIACLPIYRTYITGVDTVSERDRSFFESAVEDARRRNPRIPGEVFDYIRDTVLLRNLDAAVGEDARRDLLDFVMRLQQITPPVMAKSVEDTTFYIYNRLVSVNEVGGSPALFGLSPEDFAAENMKRCRQWPNAMLATSTHDTKRSEDVRARLNVLSELPAAWGEALREWSRINTRHRQTNGMLPAPSANDEYLLYQALLGTYLHPQPADYADRIVTYMAKATKEAKVNTSWTNPNAAYDEAMESFTRAILADSEFLDAFLPLWRRVAYFGQFNALSQTLLKLTCPGVPDTYRGTEVWDFSLVDPDNRRPVDYDHIGAMLGDLQDTAGAGDRAALADDLLANADDGRIKLYVIATALALRRAHPGLFIDAAYRPVTAHGGGAGNICAFARVRGGVGVLVVVPRLAARLTGGELRPPVGAAWGETVLLLDDYAGATARNCFTGETVALGERVPLAALLSGFPVGLYQFEAGAV